MRVGNLEVVSEELLPFLAPAWALDDVPPSDNKITISCSYNKQKIVTFHWLIFERERS